MKKGKKRGGCHFLRGSELGGTVPSRVAALFLGVLAVFYPAVSFAYVGPGAGLTMIGSAIALIVVFLVAAAGLVIWPLRSVRRRRQEKVESPRKD